MNDLHRAAANSCERSAEALRIRADRLDDQARERRMKSNKHKAKAIKLERAAVELRDAAKVKDQQATDYRTVAAILPRIERRCIGCALGYVPPGTTYNELHTCGQTVGPLKVVNE